jgi:cell division septation protein DedD
MTSDVRAAFDGGDDGFHEIQLNGKQLVFLGMATTLVSVVIFLCGVLVGRGVKPLDAVAQAGGPQAFDPPAASPVAPGAIATPAPAPPAAPPASGAAAAAEAPAGDTEPTPQGDAPEDGIDPAPAAPPAAAAVEPAPATAQQPPPRPPAAARPTPKPEPARAAAVPPAVTAPPPAGTPAATPVAEPAASPAPAPLPAPAAASAARGGRIAVQVGAFTTRGEADALARRLSGRGYAVYVMDPTDDGKAVYRVRVGNYTSADEAQRVSARLTQQEKLKPWIIR